MNKYTGLLCIALAGVSGLIIILLVNYAFARSFLLRVDYSGTPYCFAGIRQHMFPLATPLGLKTGGHGGDQMIQHEFEKAIGFKADTAWSSASEHLFAMDYVSRLNPYPQPLSVIHDPAYGNVDYLSFGYVGKDERYHQITQYWGEADSTPSLLVRKVRGPQTNWGDYFVRYTVYLSKDLKPHPVIADSQGKAIQYQAPSPYPNIDRIDWGSYEGGSYNGFEEINFALFATLIESLLVAIGLMIRRRNQRYQLQKVTNKGQQTLGG